MSQPLDFDNEFTEVLFSFYEVLVLAYLSLFVGRCFILKADSLMWNFLPRPSTVIVNTCVFLRAIKSDLCVLADVPDT